MARVYAETILDQESERIDTMNEELSQQFRTTQQHGDEEIPSTSPGISCTAEQLLYGQCKFHIYQTLGIRQSNPNTSVGLFVQDIVLSSTFFIGTVVTIALLISGLMYIFAGSQGNDSLQSKAKSGIINSLIGLAIVLLSYSIIRLAQFLARGG